MSQPSEHGIKRQPRNFLADGGEMGERIRAFDWAKTPVGPVEAWSPALRTMVGILLVNRFPQLLWWGPRYIQFYNDAYRPIPGAKHPDQALGQPARECWSEIWHVIEPLIDAPFQGGPATWMEDLFLELNRHGFVEETHFTIAYSSVPDETVPSGIGGVLATVHEITEKVVGERRVRALRDLGAETIAARSAEEVCGNVARVLAMHDKDVPFALLYLIDADGKQARLAGTCGTSAGGPISPRTVDLNDATAAGWPLAEVRHSESSLVVERLDERFGTVPPGPWSDPPETAFVMPIRSSKVGEPAGLLVAGISARLKFDDYYRSFLELLATQVATAVANARAYEEERQRTEALAELDRAKTAFFTNISHEFRTPLTLLLGPVEDALADAHQRWQRDRLELIHRNGLRLQKLVNTLLDFSRIEAGRAQASYEPTDLANFTAELASTFRSAVEKAGMRLRVDCPPLDEPVYVDRDMWEKVVLNLLSNAFKFTLDGEIEVTLREASRERQRPEVLALAPAQNPPVAHAPGSPEGHVELSVRDTGTGISAKQLPHVFERFHRIEGARARTNEGTGIGLALVQELVKLHGGTVSVQSVAGQGSTFTVTIPKGHAHLPADRIGAVRRFAPTALSARHYVEEALCWLPDGGASPALTDSALMAHVRQAATTDGPRARIVWADDNADMRDYVGRLLGPLYDVEAVTNGSEALAAVQRQAADLVLADVMMPGLDGFALLRALRSDERLRTIPVILLSARAGEEARIEGLQAGADDYLIKPFRARELLARVQAHLELARVRRESAEALLQSEYRFRDAIDALPEAVYSTDAAGNLTHFNPAAVRLSGRTPRIGSDQWCVTWKLYRPDGSPLPHDECPMAVALKEGRSIVGEQIIAERPDGTRAWAEVYPSPMRDHTGQIVGGVNMLVDVSDRKREELLQIEQNELLERIASGYSLEACLNALTRAISRLNPNTRAGVLMADEAREKMDRLCAAHVPPSFGQGIHGAPICELAISTCGTAIFTGEPVTCSDVANSEEWPQSWRDLCVAHGIRACHSTPVFRPDGQAIASFFLGFGAARAPTEWEHRLGTFGAHVAAIAIERDRTARALHENQARLAAELADTQLLQGISAELIHEDNVEVLYDKILDAAAAVMHSDFASMQMLHPERGSNGELQLLAFYGFSPEAAKFWEWVRADSNCSCGAALRTGQRVIVPDVAECAFMAGTPDRAAYLQAGIQAAQSTPLVSRGGQILGMMSTHWRQPHQPTERDLRLLDILARQAADLIERKQVEDSQRLAAEWDRYHVRVADALRPLADPIAIQAAACRVLAEHLGTERASYAEVDAAGTDFIIAGDYFAPGLSSIAGRYPVEVFKGSFDAAPEFGRVTAVADVLAEPSFTVEQLAAYAAIGVRAYNIVPLVKEGQLVAAFGVHQSTPRAWTLQEMDLVEETAERTWAAVERAKAEAALRDSEQALKEADRRKDEYLAMLAHELRNPLAPIRNSLHILRLAGSASGPVEHVVDIMERQVNQMVRLVDDLMEVSRISRGKIELRKEPIELAAIVRNAVETSKPLIEAAQHQLAISLPSEPVMLDADPVRLTQTIANLLNNAAKYTPEGGQIWLTARREGPDVVMSVRDTGMGIPERMLPQVFDLFTQVDRTFDRSQGGLGIGLTLVRTLIEMHGGSVEARSDGPGRGSEFVLRLPLPPNRPSPEGRGQTQTRATALAPRRILVVDDNRDVADSLGMLLKYLGADVATASDGPTAVAALRSYRPDVVFLDIGMPGMNGYELASHIRQQPEGQGAMLIALAGWGQDEDRRLSREAGFDHHLVKPVDLGALEALLVSLDREQRGGARLR